MLSSSDIYSPVGGIGVQLDGCLVMKVRPSSSAYEGGIRPGDFIVAVSGIAVNDESVMPMLRGPLGSIAEVVFRNPDGVLRCSPLVRVETAIADDDVDDDLDANDNYKYSNNTNNNNVVTTPRVSSTTTSTSALSPRNEKSTTILHPIKTPSNRNNNNIPNNNNSQISNRGTTITAEVPRETEATYTITPSRSITRLSDQSASSSSPLALNGTKVIQQQQQQQQQQHSSIEDIVKELNRKRLECADLKSVASMLTSENRELKEKLKLREDEVTMMLTRGKDVHNQNAMLLVELQKAAEDKKKIIDSHKDAEEMLRAIVSSLTKQVDNLQLELEATKRSLSSHSSSNMTIDQSLWNTVTNPGMMIKELTEALEEEKYNAMIAEKKVEALEHQILKLKLQNQQQGSRASSISSSSARDLDIEELKKEFLALRNAVASSSSISSAPASNNNNNNSSSSNNRDGKDRTGSNGEEEALKNKLHELNLTIDQLNAVIKDRDEEISLFKKEGKDQNKARDGEIASLREDNTAQKEKIAQLEELVLTTGDNEEGQKRLEKLEMQLKETTQELEGERRKVKNIQREMEEMKNGFETMEKELEEERANGGDLQEALVRAENRTQVLSEAVNKQQREMAMAEEVIQVREKMSSLVQEAHEAEKMNEEIHLKLMTQLESQLKGEKTARSSLEAELKLSNAERDMCKEELLLLAELESVLMEFKDSFERMEQQHSTEMKQLSAAEERTRWVEGTDGKSSTATVPQILQRVEILHAILAVQKEVVDSTFELFHDASELWDKARGNFARRVLSNVSPTSAAAAASPSAFKPIAKE